MKNTSFITRILQAFRYRSILHSPEYHKEFFLELGLLNFNRLRIFGYFIAVLSTLQLLSDIFLGEFWDTQQINYFMVLDIVLAFISFIVLAITNIHPPRSNNDVKLWHIVCLYLFIFFELLWGSVISIIESESSNSLPTFLIGVFMASTIFLVRSLPYLLLLLVSLAVTYTGLYKSGIPVQEIVKLHSPLFFLVITAWIVSRVLFNTRLRSFAITKKIEEAKNNLDSLVKERTLELSKTNEKLLEEIKERKKYEKSLEEEKHRAQEADRLKSVFLANMSHEIRTPLNGILGFGDLLKNTSPSLEKRDRYLDIIANNGQQLLKIIDDIMDISMIESNQLKINHVMFRLNHILPDAIEFFNNYKHHNNKQHLELINDGFPAISDDTVNSDPSRVQQILYNLLNNAVKFTAKGHIRLGGRIDDGYALIFVEDTGIGVKPELFNTIFERFRQGEESYTRSFGGTGLGLSISRGIAELLGGMIWLDLSYAEGSRFCFTVPTLVSKKNSILTSIETICKMLEKRSIIITDEQKGYHGYMTYLINSYDLNIPIVQFREFGQLSLDFDPYFIFYDTPEAEIGLLQHIYSTSQRFKNAEIIVLSSSNSKTIIEKLKTSGASMILTSPVNYHALLAHIHHFFNANQKVKNSSHT